VEEWKSEWLSVVDREIVLGLVMLTIGFIYRWKKGALEWN
jgi:NADH:ubiquinone oxidoreductase subunit 3 (subunit A)